MKTIALGLAAGATLSLTAPAQSAIITTDYEITGTGGSGTLSLDFDDATSAYTVSALDFFLGATFDPSNAGISPFGAHQLLGGNVSGFTVNGGTDDFSFVLDPTAASQTVSMFYSLTGLQGFGSADVTITQPQTPTPAVPEPATWVMMLIGFGAIGLSIRRRPARTTGPVLKRGFP